MAETKKKSILKDLTPEKVAAMSPEEQSTVKNSLLGQASTILRTRHADEFEQLASELFANLGLERVRRLSPEERKRKQLLELADELGVTVSDRK